MTAAFRYFLRRFGLRSVVYSGDTDPAGRTVYCFIQPLLYKNKVYLRDTIAQLGAIDKGHFLYIGPPDTELHKDGYLICGARRFDILRGEPVYLGTKVCHWCAVLQPRPEEAA